MTIERTGQRLVGLDYIRGIAASMVLWQHSFEATGYATGRFDPFTGIVNFGQAGVLAFFLVSGFVIPLSLDRGKGQSAFWIGRVFRLYPMYWVAFLATVLIAGGSADARTVLAHLFFIQEFVPGVNNQVPNSWTLSLEMVWYVSASILLAIGWLRKYRLLTLLTLSFAAACALLAYYGIPIPAGRAGMLVTCVIGMMVFRNERRSAAILVASLVPLIYFGFRNDEDFAVSTVLVSWTVAYLLFFLGNRYAEKWPAERFFAWLGRISYSVYLIHTFFIFAAESYGMAPFLIPAFTLVCTLFASTLAHRFIEQPMIDLGKRWQESRRARQQEALAAEVS